VTVPTLVVQGENDEYGTWAQVAAILRAVVGPISTVRMPACGHSPHVDQRELTLGAMTSFAMAHLGNQKSALPATSK
jgi:pimeloyl-ACP methyl ester carboxylesterase